MNYIYDEHHFSLFIHDIHVSQIFITIQLQDSYAEGNQNDRIDGVPIWVTYYLM